MLRKHLLILLIGCAVCATSCDSGAKKYQLTHEDSIAAEKQAHDEIYGHIDTVDEQKAIGDIPFNSSPKSYKVETKAFLNKCKTKKASTYKIGDYIFTSIDPEWYKGRLVALTLNGQEIYYDRYEEDLRNQFRHIYKTLSAKYGSPSKADGLPKWYTVKKHYSYRCAAWVNGDKVVEIRVHCYGAYYGVDIYSYRKSLLETKENEEQMQSDSTAKKATEII